MILVIERKEELLAFFICDGARHEIRNGLLLNVAKSNGRAKYLINIGGDNVIQVRCMTFNSSLFYDGTCCKVGDGELYLRDCRLMFSI